MSVSVNSVRALALNLPGSVEMDHGGKPSFRVRGKIFATLQPDVRTAVLKLSIDEQDAMTLSLPDIFHLTPWGHQGWTKVDLRRVDAHLFKTLLVASWKRVAPKKLAALAEIDS